jgi:hypothetical protein
MQLLELGKLPQVPGSWAGKIALKPALMSASRLMSLGLGRTSADM